MRCDVHAVAAGVRRPEDYEPHAGEEAVARLRELAAPLAGAKVLHLESAAARQRPPATIRGLVALLRGAGVDADWRLLGGDAGWFAVARQLDDGLRGGETALDGQALASFREATATAVRRQASGFDLIVLHGAAPVVAVGEELVSVAWAPGAVSAAPGEPVWAALEPHAASCLSWLVDGVRLSPPIGEPEVRVFEPALDPLCAPALELPVETAGALARSLGCDLTRPSICELWPFDPWADPFAAIDVFEIAATELPDLQLVLAGAPAPGDAEGFGLMREVEQAAAGRDGIRVVALGGGAEAGALLRLARVAVDSSLRPGGPVPALAAMWHGRPVLALGAARASHPLRDGRDGFAPDGAEQAAERLVELVRDPGLAIELGESARARVRERHLLPRLACDELELLQAVIAGDPATVQRP